MFQYAFGLATARRLGSTFAIDDAELRRIFVLAEPTDFAPVRPSRTATIPNDGFSRPEDVVEKLTDDTRYVGFFQSERFFAHFADDVRTAFRLRAEHQHAFLNLYSDLAHGAYVCCHMRRTDYRGFAGGAALPMSYYESALSRIEVAPRLPVVFVGDDLEEARVAFGDLERVRFEHNDEAIDLQLLINASAVVVSNSTFGWWGAWLNERSDRLVIAPRYWLGFSFGWEYPPCVIPDGWTQLPVRRPWRHRLSPASLRLSLGRARQAPLNRLRNL
jgi:Glycosyl transferase family 11